jgi:hypothetical protein
VGEDARVEEGVRRGGQARERGTAGKHEREELIGQAWCGARRGGQELILFFIYLGERRVQQ